jgi:hypothetical protein
MSPELANLFNTPYRNEFRRRQQMSAHPRVRKASWMSSRISQRIRSQLGDVVAVAAGQGGGERDAGGVGDQVTFAARPAPIDGASSGLGPPFNARIWEPSTAAREKSRAFALRSSARRTSWSRGHTPASVHSARRRRQVIPEPKPSSCGRCSQGFTSACCGSRHLDHHHRRHLRAPTGRLRRRGSSRRPDAAKRCEEGHKAPTTARRQTGRLVLAGTTGRFEAHHPLGRRRCG